MAQAKTSADGATPHTPAPVVVKKYANRRLYNTASSSYVTLDHLSEMVRQGQDFLVQDAKTGEDITRSVLAQIIFEQESRGQNLLPVNFLRRLIRFYGDQMQGLLPGYLDMSMDGFAAAQERMTEQMARAWGGQTPMAAFEQQARQNMALFEQALRLWTPTASGLGVSPPQAGAPTAPPSRPESATAGDDAEAIDLLRKQMEAMQRQLDQLTQSRKT